MGGVRRGRAPLRFAASSTEKAMRTSVAWLLLQLCVASSPGHAEVIFIRRSEGLSMELVSLVQRIPGIPVGVHLYHSTGQTQTTLLSVGQDGKVRVNPQHRGRLDVSGGLDSRQVNVSITSLRCGDAGLYTWELSYREENGSDRTLLGSRQVLLLVDGTAGGPCQGSARYSSLLLIISSAAALLLLTLTWMTIDRCTKARHRHRLQFPAPIYEEMTRKQRSDSAPQNSCEGPAHLEEANFPVYANPNIGRQQQENYYACPRQLQS